MENPILKRVADQGARPDPFWLLTLLSVLEVAAYPLEDWNEALTQVAGRRIRCPSYKSLTAYLQQMVLEVQ